LPDSGATSDPQCPVCGSAAQRERTLTARFLAAALQEFVERPVPTDVALHDYTMYCCTACTLRFADPPAPAGDAFYEWLDRESKYYVAHRWEWDCIEEFVRAHPGPAAVLEIGAGDARFLRRLQSAAGARTVAIERSGAAASALRAKGVEAYAEDEAGAALAGRRFDYVLAFHCVEHVVDPVGLVASMLQRAGPDGRVLFSVPYSPMYFESRWFDPLNYPPHHLTRWNRNSLERLCSRVGARARLLLPPAYPLLARARHALAIRCLGPHWSRRRRLWKVLPLLHPLKFAGELVRQTRRERVNGRVAADVVLVELQST